MSFRLCIRTVDNLCHCAWISVDTRLSQKLINEIAPEILPEIPKGYGTS